MQCGPLGLGAAERAPAVGVQADTVEVVPAKSEAVNCVWHGGALLGVIDPARDAWSVGSLSNPFVVS